MVTEKNLLINSAYGRIGKKATPTYLTFEKINAKEVAFKNNDDEYIGRLEKLRVGQWISWCLFLEPQCYLSAGCQDEVRAKTKELNGNKE